MKVYLDNPPTDLDRLILITINANPNVWTVPESVNTNENYPSLNIKYTINIIADRTPQYAASYFLKMLIRKKLDSKLLFWNYIRDC